jgi:hypothetical protein
LKYFPVAVRSSNRRSINVKFWGRGNHLLDGRRKKEANKGREGGRKEGKDIRRGYKCIN